MAKKKRYYKSSSMISEDRSKDCNLPTDVIIKKYPDSNPMPGPTAEANFEEMDDQMAADRRGMKKGNLKRKF